MQEFLSHRDVSTAMIYAHVLNRDPAGVAIAALLFGLQGILFPNPSVVAEACGHPFVTDEELSRLLDTTDYPTLLKFNRLARRNGLSGPILAAELASFLALTWRRCEQRELVRSR